MCNKGACTMKVLKPHDPNGWITAVIKDRWVQAKVYDTGSINGINNGRVSKLCIGKTDQRDPNKNFFDQMDFNYDRGLDFSNLSDDFIEEIVNELEKLPKLCPDDEDIPGIRI
jgi:hypothetical protein